MLPTIVLVGRPNVGKSTLFNRLTRTRAAIVVDIPGVTRDRHYGRGRSGDRAFLVVDTGGIETSSAQGMTAEVARQTELALAEADAIVLLTDAREGSTPQDMVIARQLRATGRPVWLAVNKAEGLDRTLAAAEFHELALGEPWPVSAAHGDGVPALIEAILSRLPRAEEDSEAAEAHPRIAVVGRPNAGKSTLANALLGQDRMITSPIAGTTRDSIYVDFERNGRTYTLIDTAGLRRRARVSEAIERFSVLRAMQAIEEANVAVLVIDATEGPSDQDATIASHVLTAGRALVVAVNKSDALSSGARAQLRLEVERRLKFLDFAKVHYISARAGSGLDGLMRSIDEAHRSAFIKMPTPRLTRLIREAIAAYPPPRKGMNRPKLRYAHQGGSNPPLIIVHGTGVEGLPESYRRYLEHRVRAEVRLSGTPLRIEFRQGVNPFQRERRG